MVLLIRNDYSPTALTCTALLHFDVELVEIAVDGGWGGWLKRRRVRVRGTLGLGLGLGLAHSTPTPNPNQAG